MNNPMPRLTYTKLFERILHSTIWGEDDKTRIVWITMLAMADAGGFVMAAVPGLARMANVDLESCQRALDKFMSPDPHSSTPDNEGRRIERVDGGWRLLNHTKYKGMMSEEHRREYKARKQAEYRAKSKPMKGERAYVKAEQDGAPQEKLDEMAGEGL